MVLNTSLKNVISYAAWRSLFLVRKPLYPHFLQVTARCELRALQRIQIFFCSNRFSASSKRPIDRRIFYRN